MGHMLEMVVHLIFHVEDYLLGYPGVYVAFQHSDNLGCRKGHKGHQKKPDEKLHIPPHQRLVHDAPGYDGRQKPHRGREQYRRKHQQKLEPIGFKI